MNDTLMQPTSCHGEGLGEIISILIVLIFVFSYLGLSCGTHTHKMYSKKDGGPPLARNCVKLFVTYSTYPPELETLLFRGWGQMPKGGFKDKCTFNF